MNPTPRQIAQFCKFLDDKSTSHDQLQLAYNFGVLADTLDANYDGFTPEKRDQVRQVLGLKPLIEAPKPAQFQFKAWKTIKLGVHKTPEEYRMELKKGDFRIGTYADQILDKIAIAKMVIEVDISEPFTVSDLGFTNNARYDEVCKRIVEFGGELCPDEVGPALRVQYPGLPNGEWFRTAMKALADSDGGLSVFDVGRVSAAQWLDGGGGSPHALYFPGDRFVCVVPRK